jgi:acyl-coenzyme A thioesterase PaaI-like protein
VLNVLINNALDGRNACYLAFLPPSNTIVLVNDAGAAGGPFAGIGTIPGTGTISNGSCTITLGASSVSVNGSAVTLNLSISFTGNFGGRRIVYVAARDLAGNNSGWQAKGVWAVPGGPQFGNGTSVVSVSPGRSESRAVTLTTVFADTAGFADLNVLNLLINNAIDGRQACYIAYVRPIRTLVLVNDAGDAGGPFAGAISIPGNTVAAVNSQCAVSALGSSVIETGNTLTLVLRIDFIAAFAGNKVVYTAARDTGGNNTGWQPAATIGIP